MYAMIESNYSGDVVRWHRTKEAAVRDALRWSLMYVYVHVRPCVNQYCCTCKGR